MGANLSVMINIFKELDIPQYSFLDPLMQLEGIGWLVHLYELCLRLQM